MSRTDAAREFAARQRAARIAMGCGCPMGVRRRTATRRTGHPAPEVRVLGDGSDFAAGRCSCRSLEKEPSLDQRGLGLLGITMMWQLEDYAWKHGQIGDQP
jgi:hypothetical protein